MSHTWLDRALFLLLHSTPSPLDPPDMAFPCVPLQGVPLGRLAEQNPITVYEPRACFGSTYTSGEDIATTPVSPEVDER